MSGSKQRHRNDGLRKACGCSRRQWPKCAHPWHFNYTVRGGPSHRFSLDAELGRHLASKTEAQHAAATIRASILAGTFTRRAEKSVPEPVTADANTLRSVVALFLERATPKKARDRAAWEREARCRLGKVTAFVFQDGRVFGEKPIGAVTEDDLEVFIAALRRGRSASTRNHCVQVLGSLFRWATKKGYLSRNPMGSDSEIRREKPARRNRRLEGDEEARLMAVAGPRLQRIIIAALETTCRRGELLKLQWKDVHLDRREFTIRAENAKDGETRILPISSRLSAVLEMARTDPAGRPLGPDAFVFGDGVGRQVKTIKRAWETAVLKAHGHDPRWGTGGKLSTESRAAFQAIDLHFHDLRHEAGSGLLEAGWPLHHVQQMLGHADISTTSTYLNVTKMGLQESMKKRDESRNGCNPVANEPPVEHRLPCNEESEQPAKPLVN
jgi:integrase